MNKKENMEKYFHPNRPHYLTQLDIINGITGKEVKTYLVGILEEKVRRKQTNEKDYWTGSFEFLYEHTWLLQTQLNNDGIYYGWRDVEELLGEKIDTRVWNEMLKEEDNWTLEYFCRSVFDEWFNKRYGEKYGKLDDEEQYKLNCDYEDLPQKVQDDVEEYIYGDLRRDTFREFYDVVFEWIVDMEIENHEW